MKLTIYKITNTVTGEVFEGEGRECAAHVRRNPSRISQAFRDGIMVADVWAVEKITDEAAKLAHARRLGFERACVICGKVFLAKVRTQKCCCKACVRENGRRQSAAWWEQNYEPVKKEVMIPKGEIARLNELARKERLSYGYYVAATEYPVKILRKW